MAKTAAERQREKRKRDTVTEENVTCHEQDVTLPITATEVQARQRGYKGKCPPDLMALPGAPNYLGVCKEVDRQWVVKPDPPAPVASMSDIDLQLRLKSYPDDTWTDSPEYQEVLRRRPTVHVFPESGMAFDKDRLKINFNMGEPSVPIDGRDPWDTGART